MSVEFLKRQDQMVLFTEYTLKTLIPTLTLMLIQETLILEMLTGLSFLVLVKIVNSVLTHQEPTQKIHQVSVGRLS